MSQDLLWEIRFTCVGTEGYVWEEIHKLLAPCTQDAAAMAGQMANGIIQPGVLVECLSSGKRVNPWVKEDWNLTQQGELIRSNPALAKTLMAAAGIDYDKDAVEEGLRDLGIDKVVEEGGE